VDVSGDDENYARQIVDVLSVVAQKNDFPERYARSDSRSLLQSRGGFTDFIKSSASPDLSTPGSDQGLGRKEAEHVNLRVKLALIA